jgi:hypothetical protein
VEALIRNSRGRASNQHLSAGIREYSLELVRHKYRDFGPTLASGVLLKKHDHHVSRDMLCKWMVEAGLWLAQAATQFPSTPFTA